MREINIKCDICKHMIEVKIFTGYDKICYMGHWAGYDADLNSYCAYHDHCEDFESEGE